MLHYGLGRVIWLVRGFQPVETPRLSAQTCSFQRTSIALDGHNVYTEELTKAVQPGHPLLSKMSCLHRTYR